MTSIYFVDHQGKGHPYATVLEKAGYRITNKLDEPEMVGALYDHDVGSVGRRSGLDYLHKHDVPVLVYPHGARPMVLYDGMYPAWPHTKAMITIGPGHQKIMELIQYPAPVEVCGWAMCEMKPFAAGAPYSGGSAPADQGPRGQKIQVLFGPIHPNANGWLHPVDRGQNALVYQRLLQTPGIQLTVRCIKRLDISGLWPAPGVKIVIANPNGSTGEIDAADVVVAHQTLAYLAVARGKPLLMFGDELTPHSGNHPDAMRWAKTYEAYREIMRYPLEVDIRRGGDILRQQMEQAMSEDVGAKWRSQFIGKALDPKKFLKTVQKYLRGNNAALES